MSRASRVSGEAPAASLRSRRGWPRRRRCGRRIPPLDFGKRLRSRDVITLARASRPRCPRWHRSLRGRDTTILARALLHRRRCIHIKRGSEFDNLAEPLNCAQLCHQPNHLRYTKIVQTWSLDDWDVLRLTEAGMWDGYQQSKVCDAHSYWQRAAYLDLSVRPTILQWPVKYRCTIESSQSSFDSEPADPSA